MKADVFFYSYCTCIYILGNVVFERERERESVPYLSFGLSRHVKYQHSSKQHNFPLMEEDD